MRNELENFWGEELRYLAIRTRNRLHLTQREMGERLEMGENSYSDIETGRYSCGMLTTILLLAMQEDIQFYLCDTQSKFGEWLEQRNKSVSLV